MKTLESFSNHFNGAHCGLGDWYPELEADLKNALDSGMEFTTGWYSSKKEIASAKITYKDSVLTVDISVSDDFDTEVTESESEKLKPGSFDLDHIREMIYRTWDSALETQKDERLVRLYSIRKDNKWIETYLAPVGIAEDWDSPPGDNYSEWGFQGEADIPDDIKKEIVSHIGDYEDTFTVGEYEVTCHD